MTQALKSQCKRKFHLLEKYKTMCVVQLKFFLKICVSDKPLNRKRGKSINGHFIAEQTYMARKHIKRSSISLVIVFRKL